MGDPNRVFLRFVNLFHIVSEVSYLLRGREETTELRSFIAMSEQLLELQTPKHTKCFSSHRPQNQADSDKNLYLLF